MRWFDQNDGGLAAALRQTVGERFTGGLAVTGRGDGGHVWLRDGQIIGARADGQPAASAALVAAGVLDARAVAELGRSRGQQDRPGLTPEVVAVVEELTLEALDQLVALPEGSLRALPDDEPPLGVVVTFTVDEVLARLQTRSARQRVGELGRRGEWTMAPTQGSGEVRVSAEEWAVLAALARPTSATELAARTGRTFEQVDAVLRGLGRRGLVARESQGRSTAAAPQAETAARPTPTPAPAAPTASTAAPISTPAPASVPATAPAPAAAPARPAPVAAVPTTASSGPSRASALKRLIGAVRAG